MFHRRYGSGGIDDVADEKTWKPGFVIVDGGELCGIVGPYKELFGVMYDSIIIGDYFRRRIK